MKKRVFWKKFNQALSAVCHDGKKEEIGSMSYDFYVGGNAYYVIKSGAKCFDVYRDGDYLPCLVKFV